MDLTYETGGSYEGVRIKTSEYNVSISFGSDISNCKLSYLHQAGNLRYFSDEDKKKILDFALTKLKGCIIINTIKKDVATFIRNNYPTYYYAEVPIGYNGEDQYHICIKNTIKPHYTCRDPKPIESKVEAMVETKPKATPKPRKPRVKKIILENKLENKLYYEVS